VTEVENHDVAAAAPATAPATTVANVQPIPPGDEAETTPAADAPPGARASGAASGTKRAR
jgi:hypothetical protein